MATVALATPPTQSVPRTLALTQPEPSAYGGVLLLAQAWQAPGAAAGRGGAPGVGQHGDREALRAAAAASAACVRQQPEAAGRRPRAGQRLPLGRAARLAAGAGAARAPAAGRAAAAQGGAGGAAQQ